MHIILGELVGQLIGESVDAVGRKHPRIGQGIGVGVWTILLIPLLGLELLFLVLGLSGSWIVLVTALPFWTLLCWVALRYWLRALHGGSQL